MAKLSEITSPEAVLKAIAEADTLGRDGFLQKYGFAESRSYVLLHEGKDYDSKAVLGAARGYQYPELGPLDSTDFSGGEKTVQRALERLGFKVARIGEQSGSEGSAPSGTWVFQGSADKFRVLDYLNAGLSRISWRVTRYADRLAVGDLVFIWQAAGKRKASAGIVAACTIVSEVWRGADDEAAHPYWVDPSAAFEDSDRVWLRTDKVASKNEIIKRDWLEKDPRCGSLLILRQPAGTNYPVTPDEARRLRALWTKTGVDWSRAECVAALRVYDQLYGKAISKLPGSPVADLAVLCGRAVGGAYNKVLNFRAIDPRDERAGLSGSGQGDREVWAEFFDAERSRLDRERIDQAFDDLWPNAWAQPTAAAQAALLEKRAEQRRARHLEALLDLQKSKETTRPPRSVEVATTVYDRDPDVVAIAKKRAGLKCEVPGCSNPTFIKRNGDEYVEVHHITTLANGGLDTIDNVACLCPSHHREIHFGTEAETLRGRLRELRGAESGK